MSHWINLKHLKVTLGVLAAICLFLWLALDPLLKWGLIRAGQAAAGAKVDIGSLKTRVLQGQLTIKDLAVANKNDPMKNLFQLDEAAFRFSPGQALRAKVVIELASLKGLQFGTARKTSGALPLSKPGKMERLVDKQLGTVEANLGADAGKAKAVAEKVDPRKLESLKSLDAAQQQLSQAGDQLKKQLGADRLEADIKDIEGQLKELQSGGTSPAEIARKAQLAARLQARIKAALSDADQARSAALSQISGVQSRLKQADDLRHKDINGLLQAAGLPSFDAESLTRHLLGPATARKISTALYWISWARQRSASQTDKAAEKPPTRRSGVNIEFPKPRDYPQFLLEKAQIDGRVEDLFQGRAMTLSGELSGVTSNPPLYGKPARLTLKGAVPGGGPTMGLDGTLDQVKKPGATELQLHYAGLPLEGIGLGDDTLGAALKGGVGRLDGTIRIVGDEWNGTVLLQADKVSLAPQVKLSGPASSLAQSALSGIKRFSVTVGISGKESDLRLKLSSDLGSMVADGLKQGFKGQLEAQRRQLEQQVDALYAARAKQLQAQTDDLSKKYLGPLDKQRARLQDQLNRAVAHALGGTQGSPADQLKKLKLNKLFK
jgi:uncharacterized protein (TIGR03545 family)